MTVYHIVSTIKYAVRIRSCQASLECGQARLWFSAAEDFEWETAQIEVDDRKIHGKARLVAVGYIGLRLHAMTFTLRGNAVRIISLRKVNRREENRYAET